MKREEAIKLIDTHTVCFYNEIDSPTLQALHLAIEALSADTVSREFYEDAVKANHGLAKELANLKKEFESAEVEFTDLPDIPRYYYEKVVGKMAHEINMLKEQLESAEAVQGEWILVKGSNGKDYHKCSKCLHTQEITGVKNYCAVCGARMKGGAK